MEAVVQIESGKREPQGADGRLASMEEEARRYAKEGRVIVKGGEMESPRL